MIYEFGDSILTKKKERKNKSNPVSDEIRSSNFCVEAHKPETTLHRQHNKKYCSFD